MYGAGESFPLQNDPDILNINSPTESVTGPFLVVYKNLQERWAIVAMDWEGEPRLGIRWFWGNGGNPISSGHATWLVVPPSLSRGMLSGLPIDHKFAGRVDDYLRERISGEELRG